MAAAVLPHAQMGTCTAALLIPISCKARTGSNYNDTFNKLLLYKVQYTLYGNKCFPFIAILHRKNVVFVSLLGCAGRADRYSLRQLSAADKPCKEM